MANDFRVCPYTWRMSFVPKFQQEVLPVSPSYPNYRGKIVFMQAPHDGYGSGEYIIVEQSPNMLFGVATGGGYGSHDIKPMRYGDGEKTWQVVSGGYDREYIKRVATRLRQFAAGVGASKREYIESVYHVAARTADTLDRLIAETEPKDTVAGDRKITGPSIDCKDTLHLCLSRDVKHLSIDIVE